MEDYKQRVIDEKEVLDAKIKALQNFVEGSKISNLTGPEENDLKEQLRVMFIYSTILKRRINRF